MNLSKKTDEELYAIGALVTYYRAFLSIEREHECDKNQHPEDVTLRRYKCKDILYSLKTVINLPNITPILQKHGHDDIIARIEKFINQNLK